MTDLARPTTRRQIPLAQPNLGELEEELVRQVLHSGVLSMGPFVEEFEEQVAALAGHRHGIAVSSGTSGLHLAVRALGIGPGDEVITTPFSFVASANCILFEGATPVFADIEAETLGLDPERAEAALTSRSHGILPVDVFGHPCRLGELASLAGSRRLHLVEDACEALGSSLAGQPAGSWGEVSVFAFYPNKQITTGEGGMVVTSDDGLARRMRSMRNQGRDDDATWLRHVQLGFNYRLDEMSAALGVAQMRRREELKAGRDRVVAAYDERLAGIDWLRLPHSLPGADVDWFLYVVHLDARIDRDQLMDQLEAAGVSSRPYFSPIHLQPYYRERYGHRPGDFPVTERIASATLALPFSSRLSDDEVDRVCEAMVESVHAQGMA